MRWGIPAPSRFCCRTALHSHRNRHIYWAAMRDVRRRAWQRCLTSFSMTSVLVQLQVMALQRKTLMKSIMANRTPNAMVRNLSQDGFVGARQAATPTAPPEPGPARKMEVAAVRESVVLPWPVRAGGVAVPCPALQSGVGQLPSQTSTPHWYQVWLEPGSSSSENSVASARPAVPACTEQCRTPEDSILKPA